MEKQQFEVRHEPERSRFTLIDHGAASPGRVIGEEQYLDLDTANESVRIMHHTTVSDEYQGQGLASVLVTAAVESTISAGLSIVPVCPYVAAWLKKHSEFEPYSTAVRPEHLEAVRA